MRLVKRLSVLAIASVLPLAACGGSDGDDGGAACETAELTTYTYVVNTAQLPSNTAEANELGLDLNDDGRPDNALGQLIAALADEADLDVNTAVTDAINNGDVILLTSLETEALDNALCARMGVFLGDMPSTPPCDPDGLNCGAHLDGATSFELSASSPVDTKINGQIVNSRFTLGANNPGNFTIQIDIAELGMPLDLDLIGARIDAVVTAEGVSDGAIGGAITEDDLNTSILPAVHGLVNDVVSQDCMVGADPCCTPDSAGAVVLSFFDEDMSCDVTLEEIQTNTLLSTLLAPDLDLLDAEGNPGIDGVADSLSIGLGFSATTGTFTVP